MVKRNIEIKVRFNRKEMEELTKKVKKSGLNRETYIRQLINGKVPKESPPIEYYSLMAQIYKCGNSLNQIASKANSMNIIDHQKYDHEVKELHRILNEITDAVIAPEEG